jgi:hypothetical protein
VHSPHGMVCSLMKECCARGPKTWNFTGVCAHGGGQSWKIGLMCH